MLCSQVTLQMDGHVTLTLPFVHLEKCRFIQRNGSENISEFFAKRTQFRQMSINLEEELTVLRREKKKAIEECQFAKAKALDSHIATLTQQIKSNKTQNQRLNARLKFNITMETVTKELLAFQTELNEQEKKKREAFHDRLIAIEDAYNKKSEKLAEKYSSDVKNANRPVPEAENLKKLAQKNAAIGNFDLAENQFNMANGIKERVLKERLDEVNMKYQTSTNELQTKYHNDINNCKAKRDLAIEDLRIKLRQEVEKRNKELNSVSLRLGLGPIDGDLLSASLQIKAVDTVDATDILRAANINENADLSGKRDPTFTQRTARKSPMTKTMSATRKSPMTKSTVATKKTPTKKSTQTLNSQSSLRANPSGRASAIKL